MKLIWGFVSHWLILVLFSLAHVFIHRAAVWIHNAVARRMDRLHPDDLPETTGHWVRQRIQNDEALHGLRVVVTYGSAAIDYFWPSAKLIHLSTSTFFKRDPSYWAVGAHEIGHARLHGSLVAGGILLTGFGLASRAIGIAVVFLLTNTLFGTPALTSAAYHLLIIGLASKVVVLLEEATASMLARRMLKADNRLDRWQRRAAYWRLFAAWSTYLADFLGASLIWFFWDLMRQRLAEVTAPNIAGPLSNPWFLIVNLLGLLLSMRTLWFLFRLVVPRKSKDLSTAEVAASKDRPSDPPQAEQPAARDRTRKWPRFRWLVRNLSNGFWQMMSLYVLCLIWNQSVEASWAVVVALAVVPVIVAVVGLLGLLIVLILYPILRVVIPWWLSRRVKREGKRMTEYDREIFEQDVKEGRREIAAGDSDLADVVLQHTARPSWALRIMSLERILYMPMLLMYWFAL